MRCGKAREWLSFELDGQLPPDRTLALEQHVDACVDCRAYRSDLLVGRRMLRALQPRPAENFEWRLRLQLNQTLREAAKNAPAPWEEQEKASSGRWWRHFGAATAVGIAAVLAAAMLAWPPSGGRDDQTVSPGGSPFQHLIPIASRSESASRNGSNLPLDRRSLEVGNRWGSEGRQATVNTVGMGGRAPQPSIFSGWTGRDVAELNAIGVLRRDNARLGRMLREYERQVRSLQALLDTTTTEPLDLPQDQ